MRSELKPDETKSIAQIVQERLSVNGTRSHQRTGRAAAPGAVRLLIQRDPQARRRPRRPDTTVRLGPGRGHDRRGHSRDLPLHEGRRQLTAPGATFPLPALLEVGALTTTRSAASSLTTSRSVPAVASRAGSRTPSTSAHPDAFLLDSETHGRGGQRRAGRDPVRLRRRRGRNTTSRASARL